MPIQWSSAFFAVNKAGAPGRASVAPSGFLTSPCERFRPFSLEVPQSKERDEISDN